MAGRTTLEKEMVNQDVSREELCRVLGVSYQTIHSKLKKKQQFKCEEMFKIKKALRTKLTLDELFSDYQNLED